MTRPTLLVTGATGKIGRHVVHDLLAAGYPVRALVRRHDARSAALQAAGAQLVVGDLGDPESLLRAMRGAQRAFFLPPFGPFLVHTAAAFAVAAREARLEHVVSLSQWLASPSHPSLTTRGHWLADHLLAGLPGIGHTIVNPGFFADNYLRTMPYASLLGLMPWVYGERGNAPPSSEDMAHVVAHALMKPELRAGKVYRPTGPKLLSAAEMVQTVERVLGHRVIRLPMPFWMFVKAARLDGASIDELAPYADYIEEHQRGTFEIGAPTDHVLQVTGRPAEDFESIARRYAAAHEARPTLAKRLRQFALFMAVPMAPGYDLKGYERLMRVPQPLQPSYAPDADIWRREHGLPATVAGAPLEQRLQSLGVAPR
ncbi:MAG: NAD-dependent epimerase/dehydratase family protein [Burkholderiales bacterium]|uniref:NmrA family NAD(P)-binding protein n=1 Tax=Roseateles sp. TaxID=1971397 RepID=UPI000FA46A7F|nr:MAG: NAD-dependent epimerase/dehydratase family protein [Burkholderiales bacterium]